MTNLRVPPVGLPWLPKFASDIAALFKARMAAPFRLWGAPTASLPTTADLGANEGALAYDETVDAPVFRNASAWVRLSEYDADVAAYAALTTTGLVVRTGSGTAATRTITGTANEITLTNGDGVSGNPTVSIPASVTFTGKTITGGTFAGPAWTGLLASSGAAFAMEVTGGVNAHIATDGQFNFGGYTSGATWGSITTAGFVGALTGNASTATKWATGRTITTTGDATGLSAAFDGSANLSFALTIPADTVTYAKMQNVSATDKVLGRSTAGAGDVEEIACTASGRAGLALNLIQGDVVYADGTGTIAKLAKNASATRYLANTGTSNNPAWAQITLTNGVTGTLPVANGGTGVTASTGSGNNVLSASPTLTGTLVAAAITMTGNLSVTGIFGVTSAAGGGQMLIDFSGGGNNYIDSTTSTHFRVYGGATVMDVNSTGTVGIDVHGEVRCNSIRFDGSVTTTSDVPTHYIAINVGGTNYRMLLSPI